MLTGSGDYDWTSDMARKGFKWDESSSAQANARACLPGMAKAYFKAGRKVIKTPSSLDATHELRLKTKAFRYALEIFRSCYGPALDRRLAALRTIQDDLGAISDYATTRKLIDSKLPAEAPERVKVDRYLEACAKRRLLRFSRYWQEIFDQPGQDRQWLRYLSLPSSN